MEAQQQFTYEDVDSTLAHLSLELGAAECHGALAGYLCAQGEPEFDHWVQQVLLPNLATGEADSLAGLRPEASDLWETVHATLLPAFFEKIRQQIDDPQFAFQLLLPDDTESMDRRTCELGQWCHNFLFGLAAGGARQLAELSAEANEALRDMVEISRLQVESQESEENEAAYAELVEYVRMGALLVRADLQRLRAQSQAAPDHTKH